MPLNNSGPISLAGATAGQSIAVELNLSATGQISLNDAAVRALAGVASGAITMPTNFYGKSNEFTTLTAGTTYTVGTVAQFQSLAATMMTTTRGIICYSSWNGSVARTFVAVFDVSGTAITTYTPVEVFVAFDARRDPTSATAFDATYALVGFSTRGEVGLIKLSGTTPSLVSNATLVVSDTTGQVGSTLARLTSTTMLAGYTFSTLGANLQTAVIVRSGDSISTVRASSSGFGPSGGVYGASAVDIMVAATNATTAVICFNKRVYPITISSNIPTVSEAGLITPPVGGNRATGMAVLNNGNYLLSNSPDGGTVFTQIVTQSGTTLTQFTGRSFGFTEGTVNNNNRVIGYPGSSISGVVEGQFSDSFALNISGTSISATRTNQVTSIALQRPVGLTTTTFLNPRNSGNSITLQVVTMT
jgi:hypothetical protein